MNDERAWFLGRRPRRARSESSGFASLGQSQRDFDPLIPSLSLTISSRQLILVR
jgi:hypothetical protein